MSEKEIIIKDGMSRNQAMARLLIAHMLGGSAMTEAEGPVGPAPEYLPEWYAKQPYAKIDPTVYFLSLKFHEGLWFVVVCTLHPEAPEEERKVIASTYREESAYGANEAKKLLYKLARQYPCVPIETDQGFIYPFYKENTVKYTSQAEERRARKSAKLARDMQRTREGQCRTKE